MEESSEDQENDHQHHRTRGSGDREKPNEANLAQVDTSHKLLKGAWIYETLGIDLSISDEENVISVGEVEKTHADGSKSKNQRCDARVDDT